MEGVYDIEMTYSQRDIPGWLLFTMKRYIPFIPVECS